MTESGDLPASGVCQGVESVELRHYLELLFLARERLTGEELSREQNRLVWLICRVEGREAGEILGTCLLHPTLLTGSVWNSLTQWLVRHHTEETIEHLERFAFGTDPSRIAYPSTALLRIDTGRYLPRLLAHLAAGSDPLVVQSYARMLERSCDVAGIGSLQPALPVLQSRFNEEQAFETRQELAKAIVACASKAGTDDQREWAANMLDALIQEAQSGHPAQVPMLQWIRWKHWPERAGEEVQRLGFE